MKNTRRLSIKREALTELTPEALTGIAGAQQAATQASPCTITNGYGFCSFFCQMTVNTCDGSC